MSASYIGVGCNLGMKQWWRGPLMQNTSPEFHVINIYDLAWRALFKCHCVWVGVEEDGDPKGSKLLYLC